MVAQPVRTKDDDCARERRSMRGIAELQAASQEANLPQDCVSMPPISVRSSRHQANHGGSSPRRLDRFPHPMPDLPAVGRIHEDGGRPPILQEAVLISSEVPGALRVVVGRARVKVEGKLAVQDVEEPLGCRPLVRARGEVHGERTGGSGIWWNSCGVGFRWSRASSLLKL